MTLQIEPILTLEQQDALSELNRRFIEAQVEILESGTYGDDFTVTSPAVAIDPADFED